MVAGTKGKRALHRAMEQLDREVEQGNANEGAHVRLAKRLKAVHDATPDPKERHIREYLLEQLVDHPIASMTTPAKYGDLIEDPDFLRQLLHRKRKEEKPIPVRWWAELMDGMLVEWYFDANEPFMNSVARRTI